MFKNFIFFRLFRLAPMRFTQVLKSLSVLFFLTPYITKTIAYADPLPEVSVPQRTTPDTLEATIKTESSADSKNTEKKEIIPTTCAHIRYTKANETEKGVSYSNFTLTINSKNAQNKTPYVLHAAHMQLTTQPKTSLSNPQEVFHNMAEAASVLLVLSLTEKHKAACSHWLEQQGQQAWRLLTEGKSIALSWNTAAISLGKTQLGIKSAQLTLRGSTHNGRSEANLALNGLDYHHIAYEDIFPSQVHTRFSIPASELPALLNAIGNTTETTPVIHVDITDLNASREDILLDGQGHATFTGDMSSSTASGHLEISHLEKLIALARSEGQMNIMAALVLARLVSHHTNTANTWNTVWENGVLTINGFPLPSLMKPSLR